MSKADEAKVEEARALVRTKIEDGWKLADEAPWMLCENCGGEAIYFYKKGHQLRYICTKCAHWSEPVKYSKKRIVRPDQKNFRENILRMYNGRCVLCGEFAEEAHHIVPIAVGNKIGLPEYWLWSISNGVALCRKCHGKWHEASYEVEQKLHYAKQKRGE